MRNLILRRPVLLMLCLCALLMAALTGCFEGETAARPDILTQKEPLPGRTQITVLVKYAFTINTLEKVVEEKFPQIDLVQVGNYAREMGKDEYAARLEHDDLTDIVMTWPLDVGAYYWEDRLLDLSGMDFTANYNLSMLNTIAKGGKLYYLPGPAQVRGIFYNKTLFTENGWQVPTNYEEFKTLCQTIEATGMRSIQLGFGNSEVLDTAFVGYSYGSCFGKPQDSQWLSNYNQGIGSFGDHFGPALDTFQDMIDSGIWKPSDLDVYYPQREIMLFTRQCAMVEDSVLMARIGEGLTGTTDEFALMPFFGPGEDSDWVRLYMVCYIGLNKHLAEPQNRAKYDLVLELMNYISSAEGQEALAGDTGAMFSSVIGVPPPDIPEIANLIPTLEAGRYGIFPELKHAQSALRTGLAGMVAGTMTKEEVIRAVDAQNQKPPTITPPPVLGQATVNFTLLETGNFVTDAMRSWSDCDFALFMDNGKDGRYNGKGISASLYAGDVTTRDLNRILPDLKHGETGTLWKVSMTGAHLLDTLEYSIPVDNDVKGWFYYFSGLKMQYAPTGTPGERIGKITTTDGSAIDPAKVYTIAIMDETVPAEYLLSKEETGVTIHAVLSQVIGEAQIISPSEDGRFTITTPQ